MTFTKTMGVEVGVHMNLFSQTNHGSTKMFVLDVILNFFLKNVGKIKPHICKIRVLWEA